MKTYLKGNDRKLKIVGTAGRKYWNNDKDNAPFSLAKLVIHTS